MAKPNNSNTNGKPTPAVQGSETPPDQNLQEGTDNINLGDQANDNADGRLLITLPADLNDGITEVVAQLKAAYVGADVDQALADRFKTDPVFNESNVSRGDEAEAGYELAFPLDVLADNITEGLLAVQTALDDRRAPDGVFFPEGLIGFQFPVTVLERYIQAVLLQERRLEEVELVFADPATDSHLKTLNFSRYLQGLTDTHFYLRFL